HISTSHQSASRTVPLPSLPAAAPTPTPTPTSSRLAEVGGSSQSGASPVPTNTSLPWTSADWRRLEIAVVDETRAASREGRKVVIEDVLEEFLDGEGLERGDLKEAWEWDKLVVRVKALQERRAKDAMRRSASRSASAAKSAAPLPPSLDEELRKVAKSSNAPLSFIPHSQRTNSLLSQVEFFQEESEDEEEEGERTGGQEEDRRRRSEEAEGDEDSGSERDEMEDTFYQRPRNAQPASDEQEEETQAEASDDSECYVVHPPPALANARFAHLYDDPIAKPPLPANHWNPALVKREPSEEYEASGEDFNTSQLDRSASATPEASETTSQAPSSARKMLNFIGGFIRRSVSPAAPSPSPEPEPGPDMTQIQRPGTRFLATPTFASTSRPFPPRPHATDRSIRPLPSTSTPGGPTPGTTRSRRRSSGEGKVWDKINALEDAESSREEDARIVEMLQSGVKRNASQADLSMDSQAGKRSERFVVYGTPVRMIPSGTRSGDGPIAGGSTRTVGRSGRK
ncbi:hypothetical protein P7C70_g4791, partial [Phenoliferia sp. Uapishka_3]